MEDKIQSEVQKEEIMENKMPEITYEPYKANDNRSPNKILLAQKFSKKVCKINNLSSRVH